MHNSLICETLLIVFNTHNALFIMILGNDDDSLLECNYTNLVESVNKCQFAHSDDCMGTYFNLFALHYCNLSEITYLTLPICILMLVFCFWMLSSTSNKYLSSSLTIITDRLGLSQNIAGMTLLAFGNGAPDIISSIAASSSGTDSQGFQLSLAALLGAGVVVTAFVFSLVIFFSPVEIELVPKMYLRENLFYLATLALLGIFLIDSKIYLWEAIVFFSFYFLNLGAAIGVEKFISSQEKTKMLLEQKQKEEDAEQATEEGKNLEKIAEEIVLMIDHSESNPQKYFIRTSTLKESENPLEIINKNKSFILKKHYKFEARSKSNSTSMIDNSYNKDNQINFQEEHFYSSEAIASSDNDNIFDSHKEEEEVNLAVFYRIKRHYFDHHETFKQMNIPNKIFYMVIEFPMNVLRDISIPAVEQDKFRKFLFSLFPAGSALTIVTFFNLWDNLAEHYIVFVIVAVIVTLMSITLTISINHNLPPGTMFYCVINFGMSVVWIWAISNVVVDVLHFIGILFNINPALLGLSLLAMGNSTPDTGLNVSLSKNGYGPMAISGSIAGPLFNLLLGFGISMIMQILKTSKPIEINFFTSSNLASITAYSALSLNLIITMILAKTTKFSLKKMIGIVSMSIFILYLITVVFVTAMFS